MVFLNLVIGATLSGMNEALREAEKLELLEEPVGRIERAAIQPEAGAAE